MTFLNFNFNLNNFCNCGLNNLFTPFSNFSFHNINFPIFNFTNFNMPIFNFPSFNMGNFMPYQSFQSLNSFQQPIFNYQNPNLPPPTPTFSAPNFNPSGNLWNQTGFNTMPNFNFDSVNFSYNNSSSKINTNITKGIPSNYNKTAGAKLARIALSKAKNSHGGKCAKAVKTALKNAGLANYEFGHAYKMTEILKDNKNFKRVSPNSVNWRNLPAGCVLVYAKGAEGYSAEYGHTEITTGDGRGVSDGITQNIKKPTAIFVPVSA